MGRRGKGLGLVVMMLDEMIDALGPSLVHIGSIGSIPKQTVFQAWMQRATI